MKKHNGEKMTNSDNGTLISVTELQIKALPK